MKLNDLAKIYIEEYEKANDDKLTDREKELAEYFFCHGFIATGAQSIN